MEYNSFVKFFKEKYGARLQKVVIDAGFSCPNRDGQISTGGCTFCDNSAFHPNYSTSDRSIFWQIEEGIKFHKVRYHKYQRYIAYFQPYSNTYAPLEKLKNLYQEALSHPAIEGIVIGTRPDCVNDEILDYLQSISEGRVISNGERKIVVVEYGIESCYDRTLKRVNRGHDFSCAVKAIEATAKRGLIQCGHFIFGLPGESIQQMLDEADIINKLPLTAVKFHQLQIFKGTKIEKEYAEKKEDFYQFTLEEYLNFMVLFLQKLRPDLYIDRFAGEVPPRFLSPLQPTWGLIRYQELVRMLEQKLKNI